MFQNKIVEQYAKPYPGLVITQNPALAKEAFRITGKDYAPVRIEASTPAGAFYALMQLKDWNGRFEPGTGVFEDSPVLGIRAYHFTLDSTPLPTVEHIKELIVQYAEWRGNMLVFEYDSHFPWKKHPAITNPQAWTGEELKEIIAFAEEYFIEVVPLLDSLGHANCYSRDPEYASLEESPGSGTLCPRNPRTLTFIEELWDEVLEYHPNARYVHITGDEVFPVASYCPRCREDAGKGNFAKLWTEYYTKLSRYVISKGKIPVIWGDMILKYPQDVAALPRDIVICDWDYTACDMPRWDFNSLKYAPGHGGSPERDALYAKAVDVRPDGTCRAYPSTAFFREQGFTVLGSSSCSIGYGFVAPRQAGCVNNQRTMARSLEANNGIGLLNTCWGQCLDATLLAMMAGCYYSWNPHKYTDDGLKLKFNREILHLQDGAPSPVDALNTLNDYLFEGKDSFDVPQELLDSTNKDPRFVLLNATMKHILLKCRDFERNRKRLAGRETPDFKAIELPSESSFMNFEDSLATHLPVKHFALDHTFGNFTFHLDSDRCLCVGAGDSLTIPVSGKYAELELVAGASYVVNGKPLVYADFVYNDSTSERVELIGNREIIDWFQERKAVERAITFYPFMLGHDIGVQATLTIVRNPHPEKELKAIRFAGPESGKGALALLALGVSNAAEPEKTSPEEGYEEKIAAIREEFKEAFAKVAVPGNYNSFLKAKGL